MPPPPWLLLGQFRLLWQWKQQQQRGIAPPQGTVTATALACTRKITGVLLLPLLQ